MQRSHGLRTQVASGKKIWASYLTKKNSILISDTLCGLTLSLTNTPQSVPLTREHSYTEPVISLTTSCDSSSPSVEDMRVRQRRATVEESAFFIKQKNGTTMQTGSRTFCPFCLTVLFKLPSLHGLLPPHWRSKQLQCRGPSQHSITPII